MNDKTYRKNLGRRALSLFLSFVMVLSLVQVGAFAAGVEGQDQIGDYTAYDDAGEPTGEKIAWANGSKKAIEDGTVTMTKDITAAGKDTFNIKLVVTTQEKLEEVPMSPDAAVVLVMDASDSMKKTVDGKDTDNSNDQRLTKAKASAGEFVDNFAADANGAKRYVSVVKFNTNADTVVGWTDAAASETARNAIKTGINGITTDAATNVEAGLQLAYNLLGAEDVKNVASRFVVLLTDGAPVGHKLNDGDLDSVPGTYSSDWRSETYVKESADKGTAVAGKIKTDRKATLYTLAFASDTDVIYNGYEKDTSYWCDGDGSHQYGHGPWPSTCKGRPHEVKQSEYVREKLTVGDWLKNSIASSSECHRNATTGQQLSISFGQIIEQIKKLMQAWQVTDPMSAMVEYKGLVGAANTNVSVDGNGVLTWNLWKEKASYDEKSGTYTYTLTYQVRLKTEAEGFVEGDYYETNGVTTLTYALDLLTKDGAINPDATVKRGYFNLPTVKGETPEVEYVFEYYLMNKKTGAYERKTTEGGTAKLWETVKATKVNDFVDDDYSFAGGPTSMTLTSVTGNENGKWVAKLYYDLTPANVLVKHWVVTIETTDDGDVVTGPALRRSDSYPAEGEKLWKGESFTNKEFLTDEGLELVERKTSVEVNGTAYTTSDYVGVVLPAGLTELNLYYIKRVEGRTAVTGTANYYYREGSYQLNAETGRYEVVYSDYTLGHTEALSGYAGDNVRLADLNKGYNLDSIDFNGKDNGGSFDVTLVSNASNVANLYYTKEPVNEPETAKLTIVHKYWKGTIGGDVQEATEYEYEDATVYVGETYTASSWYVKDGNTYTRRTADDAMTREIIAGENEIEVIYWRDARVSVEVVEHHEYHHYIWEINADTGAGKWVPAAGAPETIDETMQGEYYEGQSYKPTQRPTGGYTLNAKLSDDEGGVLTAGKNDFYMVYDWYEGDEVEAADITVNHVYRTYTSYVNDAGELVLNELSEDTVKMDKVYGKPGDPFTASPLDRDGFERKFTDADLTATFVTTGQEMYLYYEKTVNNLGDKIPVLVTPVYKTYKVAFDGTEVISDTQTGAEETYGMYYAGMRVSVPTALYATGEFTYDASDAQNTETVIEKLSGDNNRVTLVYKKVVDEREPAAVIVYNHYQLTMEYIDDNGIYTKDIYNNQSSNALTQLFYAGEILETEGLGIEKPGYTLRTDKSQPQRVIQLKAGINEIHFYWEKSVSQVEPATVEVVHHYTFHDKNPNVADVTYMEGQNISGLYAGNHFVAAPNTYNDFYTLTDVMPNGAAEGEGIVLTSGENVIHLYYYAETDTRVETRVTVNHLYYRDADALAAGTAESESTITAKAMEGDKYTAEKVTEANGLAYTFESADPASLTVTVSRDAEKNVITLRYLRAESFYTVEHVYYTDNALTGSTTTNVAAKVGDTVNAADVTKVTEYAGNTYTYTSAEPGSITVTANGGKITLRYDRSTKIELPTYFDLTVRYLDQDTGASIASAYTATIEKNHSYDVTDQDAIAISGYTYVSTTGDALTGLMTGDKLITVYYTKNSSGGDDGDGDNGGGGGGTITIPDEEPPLSELPDETVDLPDEDVPLADLPEEEVPLADVPKTGDASAVWMALAAASGMGLAALTFLGRKKDEEEA